MKRVLPLLLILILGTLFVLLLANPAPPQQASRLAQLPQLSLQTQEGETLTLPTPGKLAIVNVFASWCVPCAAEMPLLTQLADSGVPIYGIAYMDQPQALAAFLKRYGNPFTAIAMDAGQVAAQLGVTGVPESYLVDGEGHIRAHQPGMLDEASIAAWQREIAAWR